VKVVVEGAGDAQYFSRAAIPYVRDGGAAARTPPHTSEPSRVVGRVPRSGPVAVYKHIGMYAYRRELLLELAGLPQTPLEQAESLEQLRALEHGIRIRTVVTQYESVEVDTPEDLERVRRLMAVPARV
jgi:3-deoxy-manno-octulosonate cytidylyltransferase (CMP-KDO synthetase)